MPVDTPKVEALLKRPDAKTAMTANEHEAQSELFHTLQNTLRMLETKSLKGSLNYILDNELLNEYGVFGSKRNTIRHAACGLTYREGAVLSISFGTHNVGSELSFSHMGVVIADLDDYVIVVPVTTNRGQTYTSNVKNAVLHVAAGTFRKDSTLLVHQIRAVHKNRIKSDLGFSIKGTAAWDSLEKKISEKYARGVVESLKFTLHKEKKRLKNEMKDLRKEIADKDNEIADLKKQLAQKQIELAVAEAAVGTKSE